MNSSEMSSSNFWDILNRPKYVLSPMVDQSELPFRLLCRRYSAELAFTPMLHAKLFYDSQYYRNVHFQTTYEDRPLIAQFCGNDASTLINAASLIKDEVSAIDINLGCPQGIAKKGKYGAYLLDDPILISNIVKRLTDELNVNVTCKIRKVEKNSLQSTLNLCYTLQESGCKAITIHGRDKTEKGSNIGGCDWDAIKIVKSMINIPVIANGGIETFDDINRCLEYTGADGVMVSEAILENPYIFSGKKFNNIDVFEEYISIVKTCPRQKITSIRGHAFKMLYKYIKIHHNIRDAIASAQSVEDFENIVVMLRNCVNETTPYDDSWYRRYRTCTYDKIVLDHKTIIKSEYTGVISESFIKFY